LSSTRHLSILKSHRIKEECLDTTHKVIKSFRCKGNTLSDGFSKCCGARDADEYRNNLGRENFHFSCREFEVATDLFEKISK
jgi:hypothetical protein